jgi:hypothetical protein
VNPLQQPDLVISDGAIRLNHYVNSISMWIKSTRTSGVEIWVLENSGSIEILSSRIELDPVDASRVKFISTPKDEVSSFQGKSAGEFAMIKSVLTSIEESGHRNIAKVTGRLYVTNWRNCIEKSGDFHFMSARFWKPQHLVDTRFFYANTSFFSKVFSSEVTFIPSRTTENQSGWEPYLSMEHYLTERSMLFEAQSWIIKSFPVVPLYRGISASTGKQLDLRNSTLKITVSNLLRKTAIKFLAGSTP